MADFCRSGLSPRSASGITETCEVQLSKSGSSTLWLPVGHSPSGGEGGAPQATTPAPGRPWSRARPRGSFPPGHPLGQPAVPGACPVARWHGGQKRWSEENHHIRSLARGAGSLTRPQVTRNSACCRWWGATNWGSGVGSRFDDTRHHRSSCRRGLGTRNS